jgi:GDP/UDP-N,N'-diacetylbacillosamine 2-epimerase (hydrolysing)
MSPNTLLKECRGKIRVLVLTGIRSDYDLLSPLLRAIDKDRNFKLGVIVTGAHLTPLHKYSVRLVETDGFRIAARLKNIRSLSLSNTPAGRVGASAALLAGLPAVLKREKPDLMILVGDREEPLMGAIACGYMGIPVVHIAGGDHTHPEGGNIDEEVRHAISKLSHMHLPQAQDHARRLLRLGEEPWRVRAIGGPGLDRLRTEPVLSRVQLSRQAGKAALKDFIVLIHHPFSSNLGGAAREMELALKSCLATGLEVFVGSPNSDPEFADILAVLKRYAKHDRVNLYRNLSRPAFTALLRHARCLVGNSSLGLIEAPFLGLPCVNVGERQKGRLAGINIKFVPAKEQDILRAVRRAAFDEKYRAKVRRGRSPYGDGHMVERAMKILKALPPKRALLAKCMAY